jgi:hypothetical protein
MPDVRQIQCVTAATGTGAQRTVDIRNITAFTIYVTATGGTSAAFQVEGTSDPTGVSGYTALANREQGGGAYASTARTVTAGSNKSVYFDPTDNVCWVRVNITANTGPSTVNAFLTGEV